MRLERNFRRDMELSMRHRLWGTNAPAVDLDFVLIEYVRCRTVALVEYKHAHGAKIYPSNPSIRALVDLADRARVPAFCCRYDNDFNCVVTPLNDIACQEINGSLAMTEFQWMTFIYRLRGRALGTEELDHLDRVNNGFTTTKGRFIAKPSTMDLILDLEARQRLKETKDRSEPPASQDSSPRSPVEFRCGKVFERNYADTHRISHHPFRREKI